MKISNVWLLLEIYFNKIPFCIYGNKDMSNRSFINTWNIPLYILRKAALNFMPNYSSA